MLVPVLLPDRGYCQDLWVGSLVTACRKLWVAKGDVKLYLLGVVGRDIVAKWCWLV
jgi:hypothetical protein